jgi:O-antigen/teichoic acid export membrane protein
MTLARDVTPPRAAPAPHFRLTDGVVLGFAAELVLLPTGLITAAVLTRTLGPAGYGMFSVAATFITWVALTTTTLLARAAVKFVSEADDWRDIGSGVLRWRLVVGSIAFLLVLIGAPAFARLLGAAELAPYLRVFAIDLLLFNVARAYRDVLTGRGRFRAVAAVSAVRWLARLALIVALVRITGSIMGAVIGSVGATAVELFVAERLGHVPLRGRSTLAWSRMWQVAAPLVVYGAAMQLFSKIDLFVLSALRGASADAGLYAAAQNLAVPPGLFALALAPLLLATLGRLRRAGAEADARRVARDAMRVSLALVPFAAVVAGTANELVRVVFGPSFIGSGLLLALLFAAGVALVVMSVSVSVVTATDAHGVVSVLGVGVLAGALAGHLVLVPRYGAVGAAIVTTCASIAGGLASVMLVQRSWGVNAYPTLIRGAVIAGPVYWLATMLPATGAVAVAAKLAALSALVVAAFVATGELDADEMRRVRSLLPRRAPSAMT